MSCNGCRVLRKGCSESCMLRPCLQWIDSPDSQAHATVFVAKFFGRAGLMSFISAVPDTRRPALFQSLLFEACGRTVNPVNGAVGLLWTGNWHVCQAAVQTVLGGGALRPIPELLGDGSPSPAPDEASDSCTDMWMLQDPIDSRPKRWRVAEEVKPHPADLDLCLTPSFPKPQIRRSETPSMNSGTSTCLEGSFGDQYGHGTATDERKILKLFH